jgi:transcriptional antiterminator Rof (Rho-off)
VYWCLYDLFLALRMKDGVLVDGGRTFEVNRVGVTFGIDRESS